MPITLYIRTRYYNISLCTVARLPIGKNHLGVSEVHEKREKIDSSICVSPRYVTRSLYFPGTWNMNLLLGFMTLRGRLITYTIHRILCMHVRILCVCVNSVQFVLANRILKIFYTVLTTAATDAACWKTWFILPRIVHYVRDSLSYYYVFFFWLTNILKPIYTIIKLLFRVSLYTYHQLSHLRAKQLHLLMNYLIIRN